MNCWECRDEIADAARRGERWPSAAEHLVRCARCRAFSREMEVMGGILTQWAPPVRHAMPLTAERGALTARLPGVLPGGSNAKVSARFAGWRRPAAAAV